MSNPVSASQDAERELLAGISAWREGRRDEAFNHLQSCLRLDPRSARGHEWISQWFLQEGMAEEALRHSTEASKLLPTDQGIRISHACVLEAAGDLEAAWSLAHELANSGCTLPRLASLCGRMARFRPQAGRALALIQNVLRANNLSPADRTGLHFAAGGLLDSMGRYDQAFAHAAQANQYSGPPEDPARMAGIVQALTSYFTRPRLRQLPRATYRSDKPVLIVGMPRSGSSLVEQILASHPLIHGAGELDFMNRVGLGAIEMARAQPQDYPWCLDRLTGDQVDGLAQVYVDPLAALAPQALRITDKMPLNFLHLGLAQMLLPGARIIHCHRDPMDNCVSCFMTQFTAGHEFSRHLTTLGLYYRQYERLMGHWKEVLDLPILEVSYEQVVSDLEAHARRMVAFLELPWDPTCVQFHKTRRPVATASVQQVRQPIYKGSSGRWRNYEPHLGPLRAALGR